MGPGSLASRRPIAAIVFFALLLGSVPVSLLAAVSAQAAGNASVDVTGRDSVTGSTTTVQAGHTVDWTTGYTNSGGQGSAAVTNLFTGPQEYKAGSLRVPPGWTQQWTTDGTNWVASEPPAAQVQGVRMVKDPVDNPTSAKKNLASPTFPPEISVTGGGDGWNLRFSDTRVYAVNHHASTTGDVVRKWLHCWVKATGATCPGFPADGTYFSLDAGDPMGSGPADFHTPQGSDFWIDEQTNRLWTLGTRQSANLNPGSTARVWWNCLDLGTLTSCGGVDSGIDTATTDYGFVGMSANGPRNGALYAITGDRLLCLNLTTATPCPANDSALPQAVMKEVSEGDSWAPNPLILGDRLVYNAQASYSALVPADKGTLVCLDLTQPGATPCAGWPVDYTRNTARSGFPGITLLPLGDPANPTGACNLDTKLTVGINGSGGQWFCFRWDGSADTVAAGRLNATLPDYTTTKDYLSRSWRTFGVHGGQRMYLPYTILNTGTRQYRTDYRCVEPGNGMRECPGFTPVQIPDPYNGAGGIRTYTLNVDPFTDCVWENGDGGKVFGFSAYTGGTGKCGASSDTTVSATPADSYCDTGAAAVKGWDKVRLEGLTGGTVRITVTDAQGDPIQGWTDRKVAPPFPVADIDISAIPYSSNAAIGSGTYDTRTLTIEVSASSPNPTDWSGGKQPTATISWDGDPVQMCVQTVAQGDCNTALADIGNDAAQDTVYTAGGTSSTTASKTLTDSANPGCGFKVVKKADRANAPPGAKVTYTITATNTGPAQFDNAAWTDDLTDVLDDATYTNDAAAATTTGSGPAGNVSYSNPTLSWTGNLAVGQAVTVTYSVTVGNPPGGNKRLDNTVVAPASTNCQSGSGDPDCTAAVTIPLIEFEKTADKTEASPGDTVNYTVTVSNIGTGPATSGQYTGNKAVAFVDILTGVLDDATYNNDAAVISGPGSVSYSSGHLDWKLNSGEVLPAAGTATITYSVTVKNPDPGNHKLSNTVRGPAGTNCAPGSADPKCRWNVQVPNVHYAKVADKANAQPGETVTYTITVANTGAVAAAASFDDDLTKVLDDATYNNDAQVQSPPSPGGTPQPTYAASTLSWSMGSLGAGETVQITYSVTVKNPNDQGNHKLVNTIVSPPGTNCEQASGDPDCTAAVKVSAIHYEKTRSPAGPARPGDVVDYTIRVENTGAAAGPASFTDDLSDVIDDATYRNDAAVASGPGSVSYAAPVLSYTAASLGAGQTATITYSVKVKTTGITDHSMVNTVISPTATNCQGPSPSDADCRATVKIAEVRYSKSVTPAGPAKPGQTLTYTVRADNVGAVDSAASFTDDLTDVTDDATYNNDATVKTPPSPGGTPAPSYNAGSKELSWSWADLPIGETVEITYTVTVKAAADLTGTPRLVNPIVSPNGTNCASGSKDAACSVTVPIELIRYAKTSDSSGISMPGDTVTYTITAVNAGTADAPASFTDDLTDVIDDATYNNDATADRGSVAYTSPYLNWSVASLPAGTTATVTYTVTLGDPPTGNQKLRNAIVSPPGTNCAQGATDPDCKVVIRIPDIHYKKVADKQVAQPGETVTYTVTAENIGSAPADGSFTDDLAKVLDDATWDNNVTASSGSYAYAGGVLTWDVTGLPASQTATITYTVTVKNPSMGNFRLRNTIVSPDKTNCHTGSTDPDCTAVVLVPNIHYDKDRVGTGPVAAGDTVTYRITVENTGAAAGVAQFTDDLTDVLDDAVYLDDAAVQTPPSPGGTPQPTYSAPSLSWTMPSLDPGAKVAITYSVVVKDAADQGDHILRNAIVSPPNTNCATGSGHPECSVTVKVPAISYKKVVNTTAPASPGDTRTYTITAKNVGAAAGAAVFSDDLTKLLDDAKYNNDAQASVGNVSYSEPILSWTDTSLAAGQTATVTYSVTVKTGAGGDGSLVNGIESPPGTNCEQGSSDPDCTTTVPVPSIRYGKTVDNATPAKPGDTRVYTITVENTSAATGPAEFTDDLTGVLDDATYNNDAKIASGPGIVTYTAPVISWSATSLAPGQKATITYSVTVKDPPGDMSMVNTVVSRVGTNCAKGSVAKECTVTVPITAPTPTPTPTPGRAEFEFGKTVTPGGRADSGDTLTYTITARNTGTVAGNTSWSDDLTRVLDDAAYNNDATASSGVVRWNKPALSWQGALQSGQTATVTYTVTVRKPANLGDRRLVNAVVSPTGTNCQKGSADGRCAVVVKVPTPDTPLTVVTGKKKPKTDKTTTLVKRVKTTGTKKVTVTCRVGTAKVSGKICGATIKKNNRVTVKPRCNDNVRIAVKVVAREPGMRPSRWTRTWKVKKRPVVSCRSNANG